MRHLLRQDQAVLFAVQQEKGHAEAGQIGGRKIRVLHAAFDGLPEHPAPVAPVGGLVLCLEVRKKGRMPGALRPLRRESVQVSKVNDCFDVDMTAASPIECDLFGNEPAPQPQDLAFTVDMFSRHIFMQLSHLGANAQPAGGNIKEKI